MIRAPTRPFGVPLFDTHLSQGMLSSVLMVISTEKAKWSGTRSGTLKESSLGAAGHHMAASATTRLDLPFIPQQTAEMTTSHWPNEITFHNPEFVSNSERKRSLANTI